MAAQVMQHNARLSKQNTEETLEVFRGGGSGRIWSGAVCFPLGSCQGAASHAAGKHMRNVRRHMYKPPAYRNASHAQKSTQSAIYVDARDQSEDVE